MSNESNIKSCLNNDFIALVGGVGAGSKYFQSLLDLHPDIYMIPGYSLLYFYPHYKEISNLKDNKEEFISLMLDRLPIHNSSIMPGSEGLDKLGENGDKKLIIDKIYL